MASSGRLRQLEIFVEHSYRGEGSLAATGVATCALAKKNTTSGYSVV